jgi:cellulose synthase/poly-beta-1,6-N-acetylglucosamine synthase-like glycosyltransferase
MHTRPSQARGDIRVMILEARGAGREVRVTYSERRRRMRLSVIIPVYNEEQTIHEVLERVAAVDLGGIEMEIVIANDGSTDGTRRAIDERRLLRT